MNHEFLIYLLFCKWNIIKCLVVCLLVPLGGNGGYQSKDYPSLYITITVPQLDNHQCSV